MLDLDRPRTKAYEGAFKRRAAEGLPAQSGQGRGPLLKITGGGAGTKGAGSADYCSTATYLSVGGRYGK